MMTSKIEDRLRKNGVKIKKYYKWLRWSMIYFYLFDLFLNRSAMTFEDVNHPVTFENALLSFK